MYGTKSGGKLFKGGLSEEGGPGPMQDKCDLGRYSNVGLCLASQELYQSLRDPSFHLITTMERLHGGH